MQVVAHRFAPDDLVGGHPALDFSNTASGRDMTPTDRLIDFAALISWATLSGTITASEATALRAQANAEAARAAEALTRARGLREALFAIYSAIARGERAPAAALRRVEADWKRAARTAALTAQQGRTAPHWRVADSALDLVRDRIGWSAVQLLGDDALQRLRLCDGENCAWLFLDTSKNGRRRWCDMATCGNVAKARRHYARSSQPE
jgi:predicted RNA-binding Zn ribbon-like protein